MTVDLKETAVDLYEEALDLLPLINATYLSTDALAQAKKRLDEVLKKLDEKVNEPRCVEEVDTR